MHSVLLASSVFDRTCANLAPWRLRWLRSIEHDLNLCLNTIIVGLWTAEGDISFRDCIRNSRRTLARASTSMTMPSVFWQNVTRVCESVGNGGGEQDRDCHGSVGFADVVPC